MIRNFGQISKRTKKLNSLCHSILLVLIVVLQLVAQSPYVQDTPDLVHWEQRFRSNLGKNQLKIVNSTAAHLSDFKFPTHFWVGLNAYFPKMERGVVSLRLVLSNDLPGLVCS